MAKGAHVDEEPSWLDPRSVRKTPYTNAELDALTNDMVAILADTPAWRKLVADVGEQCARKLTRDRLARRDPNSLIAWQPSGPMQ